MICQVSIMEDCRSKSKEKQDCSAYDGLWASSVSGMKVLEPLIVSVHGISDMARQNSEI